MTEQVTAEQNPSPVDWVGAAHLPPLATVRKWLVVVATAVVMLGCAREWLRLAYRIEGTSFFSLNREQNLGSWFSATMLAGCALLLLTAGRRAQTVKQRHASFWFVLCIAFVALSIDEASSIHELLMVPIQNALHSDGLIRYAWVVPAIVMVPLFALTSLPFLFSLPKRTALWFMGSGVIYVSGALGFEMLEGLTDGSGVVFVLFYLIEETLEIVGILSFFFSLMAHLATLQPTTLQKPF